MKLKSAFIDILKNNFNCTSNQELSDYGLDDRGSIPGWGKGFFL
jgi:hypothetical protein